MEKELASLEGGNEGEEEGDVEREEDADVEIDFLYALSQDALSGMSRKDPRRKALIAFVKAKDAGDVDAIRETVGPVRDIADTAPDMPDAAEEPEVAERSVPRTRTTGGKEVRRAGQAPSPRPVAQGVAGGEQREDTPKFEGELSRAGERLYGYVDFRARARKTTANDPSYRPPPDALRRETAGDILLYILTDRTTQVWIKGSMTETFEGKGQGSASWKKAAQYAKMWLDRKAKQTGQVRKSHLGMRVVVATEAEPEVFKVAVPARSGPTAAAPKRLESLDTIMEQLREEPKSRSNPRSCREGYLRNPLGRQVVADVQEVFRRSNPGGLVTALVGAAGFVAGTYAEAEFGLSKQFTRGGRATATGAREVARAAQERRLPALPRLPVKPKAKTTSDFKPSTRLDTLLRSFYTLEEQKKRTPFSQAKKREELEDRLDEMWGQIEALKEQEMATQGIRSNPRAPYWFVPEGSGYRLLKNGEPTGTRYASLAEAKADASAKNAPFRKERKSNPSPLWKHARIPMGAGLYAVATVKDGVGEFVVKNPEGKTKSTYRVPWSVSAIRGSGDSAVGYLVQRSLERGAPYPAP